MTADIDPCRQNVLAELARHNWQLVSDEENFDARVCAELAAAELPKTLARVVVRHYSEILYAACGERNSPRQRRAFLEVWNYLYPIAERRAPRQDLAQEWTQQAIVQIWKQLDKCRAPGSFLGFAMIILINVGRAYYRSTHRPVKQNGETFWLPVEESASDLQRDDQDDEDVASDLTPLSNVPADALTSAVEHDERRRELIAIIRHCLKNRQQQIVVIEEFFNDQTLTEIAIKLGTSITNVHVLKHRAKHGLARCAKFNRFYEEQLDG